MARVRTKDEFLLHLASLILSLSPNLHLHSQLGHMFVFELFLTLDTKLCSTSAMSSVATITVKLLPSARRRHPTAAQFIEFHSLAFQLRSLEVIFVTSTKVFTAYVGERKHDPRFSGILALAPSKPGGRVCAEISCDGMCTSSSVSKHFWKKRIPKTA